MTVGTCVTIEPNGDLAQLERIVHDPRTAARPKALSGNPRRAFHPVVFPDGGCDRQRRRAALALSHGETNVIAAVLFLSLLAAGTGKSVERPWPCHVVDDSSRGADGVKLGDVNGDGLLDIATGWEEGGLTRVYLHPGPAQVMEKWPAVTVGRTPSVEDAVWVDLDADGATDVVTCCEGRTRTTFVHWAPTPQSNLLSPAAWQQEAIPVTQDVMQWMFAQPVQIDGAHGVDLVLAAKGQNAQLGWLQSPANTRDQSFQERC